MILQSSSRFVLMFALGMVSTLLLSAISTETFAATAGGLGEVQQNIAKDAALIPRLVAVFAYVIATFFGVTGLFKFKDWVEDSSKNSLNPAIFRFVVAALLLALPHVWVVINTSIFGSSNGGTRTVDISVQRQSLTTFKGSKTQ